MFNSKDYLTCDTLGLSLLFDYKRGRKTYMTIAQYIVHNIYKVKVKLATLVEGDTKAPFSIATTPKWREARDSFPWITPLYSRYVLYTAESQARRYQVPFLKSWVWRDLGSNPGLPGFNIYIYIYTHTCIYIYIYIYVSYIYIYIYIYIRFIYIYIYIYMVCWVLWHINLCWLLNAKSIFM